MERHIVAMAGPIGCGKSTLAEFIAQVDPTHSAHLETSRIVTDIADQFNQTLAINRGLSGADEQGLIDAANQALDSLLTMLSTMAERRIQSADVWITSSALASDRSSYAKLFQYFDAVKAEPSLLSSTIVPETKADYRPLLQWLGGYLLQHIDPLLWYKELFRRISELPVEISVIALTAPRQPAEAEYVQSHGGKVVLINRPGTNIDGDELTERRVAEIKADCSLANDGTLEQLQACAKQVRADLIQSKLHTQYQTSTFSASGA